LSQTDAQPKPPWAKNRGGLVDMEVEGAAKSSSRGPEGVRTYVRSMPSGSGFPRGGFGDGARHCRAKGPNGIVMMVEVRTTNSGRLY
jgi:hypothetical protein